MHDFSEEDWMLAALRVEIHALCHAFQLDAAKLEEVDEADPPTAFTAHNMAKYFTLYTNRQFSLWPFQVNDAEALLNLIPDVAGVDDDGFVVAKLPREFEIKEMILLTEEARLVRKDRMDAGDDSVALKFTAAATTKKGSMDGRGKGGFTQGWKGYNQEANSPRPSWNQGKFGGGFQQKGNGYQQGGYQNKGFQNRSGPYQAQNQYQQRSNFQQGGYQNQGYNKRPQGGFQNNSYGGQSQTQRRY